MAAGTWLLLGPPPAPPPPRRGCAGVNTAAPLLRSSLAVLRHPRATAPEVAGSEAKKVAGARGGFPAPVPLCRRALQRVSLGGLDLLGAQSWSTSTATCFVPILYAWLPRGDLSPVLQP